MTTLAILTLFLGLTTGVDTVAVSVEGPAEVARLELRLEGETCGERSRPPWQFRCDFGTELAPHRLEAVAFDADGGVLARVERLVNVAPRQAEAELVVERGDDGRAEALRVVWQSVAGSVPSSLQVSLDDAPLALPETASLADGSLLLPLPAEIVTRDDATSLHFASAELTFPDGTAARADAAFGGVLRETVSSGGTGVPLQPAGGLTPAEAAAGLTGAGGSPLRPLAFESGEADVVAVVEASAAAELAALRGRFEVTGGGAREGVAAAGLEPGDRFTLVDPTPRAATPDADPNADPGDVLFRASPARFASQGGLVWQLTHVSFPPGARQNLADAVAIAGMQAAAGSRPRAVLLVLGPEARDDSRFSPAQVRRYLDRLRVPLAVWWLEREPRELSRRERRQVAAARAERRLRQAVFAEAWEGVEVVGDLRGLARACRRLRDRVADQRVLWVEGVHLPTEIHRAGQPTTAAAPFQLLGVDAVRGDEVRTAEEIRLPGGEEALPPGLMEELLAESGLERDTPAGPEVRPATAQPGTDAAHAVSAGGPLLLDGPGLETFRDSLRVDLVEVEAVVVDHAGRPVTDLGPEDFQLLEDGRPVEVRHFARVPGATGPPSLAGDEGGTVAEAASGSGETPAAAGPAGVSEPVHVILYLDDAQMEARERNVMLARMEPFVRGLPAGARVQLLVHQPGRGLEQTFTPHPDAVMAALERAATGSGGARQRDRERWQTLDRMARMDSLKDALRVADLYASKRMNEIRTTLAHLASVVDRLAPLPGRKALVYLGSGLQMVAGKEAFDVLDPGPGANTGSAGQPAVRAMHWDATPLYRELAARASAARVAVYTIDAGGVRGAPSFDVERRWTQVGEAHLASSLAENAVRPLQLLAQQTGGVAITGTLDVGPELARAAEDFQRYYVLGFQPAARDGEDTRDGELHELEVRVRRPGLRVRHRPGYRQRAPEQRLVDAVTAALSLPPEESRAGTGPGAGLRLEVGPAQALDDGTYRVPVRVRIPFADLVLVPSGSRWVNDLEIFVGVQSADGQRSPVRRAPVSVDLSADAAAAARGDYTVTLPLLMQAGEHRVAVGVRDRVTGGERVTSAEAEVTVDAPLQIQVARKSPTEEPVPGAYLLDAVSPGQRRYLLHREGSGFEPFAVFDPHPFTGGLRPTGVDGE